MADPTQDDSSQEDEHDYKLHAEGLKEQGNKAFQSGDVQLAIRYFTQAIDIDPDNHVYYSNRAAAYMKADSKSKALHDGEKCVELAPSWSKGYSRLGAAQQSLKRFETAMDSFKKGIELDPNNKSLWSSLTACKAAYEADKKVRFAAAKREREIEEQQIKRRDELKKKIAAEREQQQQLDKQDELLAGFFDSVEPPSNNNTSNDGGSSSSSSSGTSGNNAGRIGSSNINATAGGGNAETSTAVPVLDAPAARNDDAEDDALADFFGEVSASVEAVKERKHSNIAAAAAAAAANGANGSESSAQASGNETTANGGEDEDKEPSMHEHYTKQNLGTGQEQCARLMAPRYEWRNLNPYLVFQLDTDATEEDIKFRYKKLSLKVHPDRLRDVENARQAFEEVKNAYLKLTDEKQRENIKLHIDGVRDEYRKERRRLINKGMKESELPKFEDELQIRIMKHFAEIEHLRRRSEENRRMYNARDKMTEQAEEEQKAKSEEFDKNWSEELRRDNRIGNWRDFQTEPVAKRVKASSYKEEIREETKHGVAKLETWKRSWK